MVAKQGVLTGVSHVSVLGRTDNALFVHKETQNCCRLSVLWRRWKRVAKRVEVDGIRGVVGCRRKILGEDAVNTSSDTLDVWFDSGSRSYSVVGRTSGVMGAAICIWKALTSIAAGLCHSLID